MTVENSSPLLVTVEVGDDCSSVAGCGTVEDVWEYRGKTEPCSTSGGRNVSALVAASLSEAGPGQPAI